ncbi:MAG: hypothetical protein HQL63_01020 [Magnetococcales bacterium]|nr:hypothetical protein [Magnetococcales bacterium]
MSDSNAERQRRFAAKAKDAGKIRIHAWVEVSTASQLRELATQNGSTIGDVINMLLGMLYPPGPMIRINPQGDATPDSSASDSAALQTETSLQQMQNPSSPYLFRPIPGNDMPKLETPAAPTEMGANRNKKLFFSLFVLIVVGVGVAAWQQVLPRFFPYLSFSASTPLPPQKSEAQVLLTKTGTAAPLERLPTHHHGGASHDDGKEDRLKLNLSLEFK